MKDTWIKTEEVELYILIVTEIIQQTVFVAYTDIVYFSANT